MLSLTNTILDTLLAMRLSQARLCYCMLRLSRTARLRELPGTTRVLRVSWVLKLAEMKPGCTNMKPFGRRLKSCLGEGLTGESLSSGKYVNPKLITWDGEIRTGFRGTSSEPEDIGSCYATGVLKIGSLYRQGSNYHLQVFLKECKYRERDVIFQSLLSDDEGEGCDAVH